MNKLTSSTSTSTSIAKASRTPKARPPAAARELAAECSTNLYMISEAVGQVESVLFELERGSKDWISQLTDASSELDSIMGQAEVVQREIQLVLNRK